MCVSDDDEDDLKELVLPVKHGECKAVTGRVNTQAWITVQLGKHK